MLEEQKPQEFPPLEVPCPHCIGRENLSPNDRGYYCDRCDNGRVVLTPFGKAVLDFLKKHFRMEGGFK